MSLHCPTLSHPPSPTRLTVAGNGMAGARAVEEILRRDPERRFEITVIGEEQHGSYNRIRLPEVLTGQRSYSDLQLHSPEWFAGRGVRLLSGTRVTSIDRERRVVHTADSQRVSHDVLLLATGSRPHLPRIEGLKTPDGKPKPGVFTFRTFGDAEAVREYADGKKSAVVVGGGLLGLEAARALQGLGLEVTVVHRGRHLMDRQLDAGAGDILRRTLERSGISFHLSRETGAVLGAQAVEAVAFYDAPPVLCDLAVFACGTVPNVELARDCGLPTRRGILVDDRLASIGDSSVFAIGDCAEHRERVYGLVAPAWEQAEVLAERLTGRDKTTYTGSREITRLKVAGVDLVVMGRTVVSDERDEVVVYSEASRGIYQKLVLRDGILVGAILLGDAARAANLSQAFERSAPLPDQRSTLLFDLQGLGGAVPVDQMPDDETVCHCNAVRKRDLRECVAGGAHGAQDVVRATRAGTGCGSCKLLVKALVDRFVGEAPPIVAREYEREVVTV